ncbi:fimbrial biogenesis chaperone [Salmonella enterica subsp. enterica]
MKYLLCFLGTVIIISFCILLMLFGSSARADDGQPKFNIQKYGLVLSQNRVIFPKDAPSVGITVKNPQDYPVLVHSRILAENKLTKGGFMITPPLFRLDAGRANVIKIIPTGTIFPEDREQLQWLCVKGIPPKKNDEWARDPNEKEENRKERSMTLRLSVDNCIKLFVRPDSLSGGAADRGDKLAWKVIGSDLVASNPTPYYMNLSMIQLGKANIPPDYVAPFAEKHFPLPKTGGHGELSWKILTDVGVESPLWTTMLR